MKPVIQSAMSNEGLAASALASASEAVRLRAAVANNPHFKAARGHDRRMQHQHERKVRMYADIIIARLKEQEIWK